jgi:hypothetical protein
LHYNRTFKYKEHAKGKQTEVPIFIKKPKAAGKDLKDKEWRNKVFFVYIKKFRDWNVNLILSPHQPSLFFFNFTSDAFSILIKLNWLIDREWNWSKCLFLSIVQ